MIGRIVDLIGWLIIYGLLFVGALAVTAAVFLLVAVGDGWLS